MTGLLVDPILSSRARPGSMRGTVVRLVSLDSAHLDLLCLAGCPSAAPSRSLRRVMISSVVQGASA